VNRVREWQHAHPFLTVWVAMGAIVIAGFWAQQVQAHARASALRHHTEEIAARLVVERDQARHALCVGIETFTNKLIEVPSTNRTVTQAQRQAQIDSFQLALNNGFGEFGCVFHLSPAPP